MEGELKVQMAHGDMGTISPNKDDSQRYGVCAQHYMGTNGPRTLLSCWCSNNLGLRKRDCWHSMDKDRTRKEGLKALILYSGLYFQVVLCG